METTMQQQYHLTPPPSDAPCPPTMGMNVARDAAVAMAAMRNGNISVGK